MNSPLCALAMTVAFQGAQGLGPHVSRQFSHSRASFFV